MGKFFFILLLATSHLSLGQNTLYQESPDRYFRDGLELLDKEKYGAAQQAFGNYLDLEQGDFKEVEAKLYSALCGLYLFHPDAEGNLSWFIAEYPSHPKLDLAFINLGDFYFRSKKFKKTIEYLERGNQGSLSPDQKVERSFKLGYAYFASKEFEKSLTHFNQVKDSPGNYYSAANYYAGYIEFRQEQFSKALLPP